MRLRTKLSWIAILYFAQGFPFGVAYDVWPVYFRVHGVSLREIGLMSLLFLPYTLKPAWAPLVDRLGSRQAWIAGCQILLAASCLAMLAFDPSQITLALTTVLVGFTLLSATQDIAIDAYAIEVSEPRETGHVNGMRVGAWRVGALFAAWFLLLLSDRPGIGWEGMWVVAAGACVVLAVLTFISPRIERERPKVTAVAERGRLGRYRFVLLAATAPVIWQCYRSGWSGLWLTLSVIVGTVAIVSFLSPDLLAWIFRKEMLPVVGFILVYKIGDSTLGRMVRPFWVDEGMTATEIATVSHGLGMVLTILGAMAGGWFISRYGVFQGLLWLGIVQLLSNFGYVIVAWLDLPHGTTQALGISFGPAQYAIYTASVIESFSQGLGTAAFLSFLMILADRTHAATQYALLSATFSVARDVAGAFSGIGAERLGYSLYFTVTAMLAIPGLLLLPFIRDHIREKDAATLAPAAGESPS